MFVLGYTHIATLRSKSVLLFSSYPLHIKINSSCNNFKPGKNALVEFKKEINLFDNGIILRAAIANNVSTIKISS